MTKSREVTQLKQKMYRLINVKDIKRMQVIQVLKCCVAGKRKHVFLTDNRVMQEARRRRRGWKEQ